MSVDMFMKVTGADGESQDSNHKGWTDIVSFQWGVTQPSSMFAGGGGGASKASFQDLTVIARIDKSLPSILDKCARGDHLTKVEISVCKAGGTQIEYQKVTLSELVLITNVTVTGASDDDHVMVHYGFQAAKIQNQYWEQSAQGGKGAESQMSYNVKANAKG